MPQAHKTASSQVIQKPNQTTHGRLHHILRLRPPLAGNIPAPREGEPVLQETSALAIEAPLITAAINNQSSGQEDALVLQETVAVRKKIKKAETAERFVAHSFDATYIQPAVQAPQDNLREIVFGPISAATYGQEALVLQEAARKKAKAAEAEALAKAAEAEALREYLENEEQWLEDTQADNVISPQQQAAQVSSVLHYWVPKTEKPSHYEFDNEWDWMIALDAFYASQPRVELELPAFIEVEPGSRAWMNELAEADSGKYDNPRNYKNVVEDNYNFIIPDDLEYDDIDSEDESSNKNKFIYRK